jgi:hypothetical protein
MAKNGWYMVNIQKLSISHYMPLSLDSKTIISNDPKVSKVLGSPEIRSPQCIKDTLEVTTVIFFPKKKS